MTAQWTPPGFVQAYKPTPEEKQELADLQAYLAGHARAGTLDQLPEGSINGLLNKASPNVRAHMLGSQAIVSNFRASGGREMPFEPKRTVDDLDVPKETRAIMSQADTESAIYGLNERMGTAEGNASIADAPPTTRDFLEAAYDHHEGSTND